LTDVSNSTVPADFIQVLICDDSAVVRGILRRFLEKEDDISVVDAVPNGKAAVERIRKRDVDVVILDIEMPVMDGLEALPKILAIDPTVKVIMASTLTDRNASISLKALDDGAVDYVPKPSTGRIGGAYDFQREVVEKVRVHGQRNGGSRRRPSASDGKAAPVGRAGKGSVAQPAPGAAATKQEAPAKKSLYADAPVVLTKGPLIAPQILAIGASTGGPQALLDLLKEFSNFRYPILITQHMPPTFTKIFAERLQRVTGIPADEAADGDVISGGRIYVAPGDYHMIAETDGKVGRLRLTQSAPENFCRPAVDPMLRSLADVYGNRVLTVIMTGMGHDGLEGARRLRELGSCVVAQDEATSVVWGMPGAVATAGLCSAVLPKNEVAAYVLKVFGSR
jgi:two-component system, chemotaxis family, protein-glutamate methylesterase/glutaminase